MSAEAGMFSVRRGTRRWNSAKQIYENFCPTCSKNIGQAWECSNCEVPR